MKTALDCISPHLWVVESTLLESGRLVVFLAEGFVSEKTKSIRFGEQTLSGLHKIDTGDRSRRFQVEFPDVVLMQIYDENCQKHDDYEQRDEGVIGVYSQSRLLDFVAVHTDIDTFIDARVPGEMKHYDLQTGDDCFHVLGRETPIVISL